MRRSVPTKVEFDDEADYHIWGHQADRVGTGCARGVLIVLAVALFWVAAATYLLSQPANPPGPAPTPAGSVATPSPHGPPPPNWTGVG